MVKSVEIKIANLKRASKIALVSFLTSQLQTNELRATKQPIEAKYKVQGLK